VLVASITAISFLSVAFANRINPKNTANNIQQKKRRWFHSRQYFFRNGETLDK
jgi:hypothetical protein